MVEIAHVTRAAMVETSTIRWNRMISETEADEIIDAAIDEETRSDLEDKINDLESRLDDLRRERNTRVRAVIAIARKMLAGNAGIREESDLYWHMKAQLRGQTKPEMERQIAEDRAREEAVFKARSVAKRRPSKAPLYVVKPSKPKRRR